MVISSIGHDKIHVNTLVLFSCRYMKTIETITQNVGKYRPLSTWRNIPVSKWLITMVIVSPLSGVVPLPNGRTLRLINGGDPFTTYVRPGMILQVPSIWDSTGFKDAGWIHGRFWRFFLDFRLHLLLGG